MSPAGARTGLATWALDTEGSTRSSALMRIGLAFLVLTRFGDDVLPLRHPEPSWIAFGLAFYASACAMACGLWSRASTAATGALLLVAFYYRGVQLGFVPWVAHHTYLLVCATVLCACTPCGRSYSLDRWLALRSAERAGTQAPPERGNLWAVRLIAIQVSLVYFWSAFDKSNGVFLSGVRLVHYAHFYYLGSDPAPPGFATLAAAAACITVALEYALAGGLFFARTRGPLALAGLCLHAAFFVLLPVRTFTATMWLLYLAYFDADGVHRVLDRLQGLGAAAALGEAAGPPS